jgi:hypothetical protein
MKKSEAKIDVKVRLITDRSLRGVIVAASSRKNKDDVIVEWEDGDCSPIKPQDIEAIPPSDANLEKEFENLVDTIGQEIKDKIDQAETLLNEACALADEYGIPFFTNVSLLGQPYVPEKFGAKWRDLDRDFVTNMTEVMAPDLGSSVGWAHSSIC